MSTVLLIPNCDFSSMAIRKFDFQGSVSINTSVYPVGAGTVSGAGTYQPGDLVTLNATANEGRVFVNWDDDVTTNPRQVAVGIIDKTYIANFVVAEENEFAWGEGGITKAGQTSGSTNNTMSTKSNTTSAYEYASHTTLLVAANGYLISAYTINTSQVTTGSNTPSGSYHDLSSNPIDSIVVPKGKYYQVAIKTINGNNADTSVGYKSLLVYEYDD